MPHGQTALGYFNVAMHSLGRKDSSPIRTALRHNSFSEMVSIVDIVCTFSTSLGRFTIPPSANLRCLISELF